MIKILNSNHKLELCESISACSWGARQKSGYIKDKSGLNSKIYLAVNEHELSVKFIVTERTLGKCLYVILIPFFIFSRVNTV